MLLQRVITAVVLAPLVVAAVVYLPTPAMGLLAALALLLAFDEWAALCGARRPWQRLLAAVGLTAVLAAVSLSHSARLAWWLLLAGCLWWLLALAWLRNHRAGAAPTTAHSLLKLAAGLLAVVPAWVALMWLHGHARYGVWLLLALLLVWAADIGAYFAGSHFGRRKLAPNISPGKTWAGVWGGIALALLVALVASAMVHLAWPACLGLLALTAIAVAISIVGDLTESLLKRQAAVKDSGSLMPGHGGMFDRLDSLCALLPVFAVGLRWLGI